MLAIAIKTVRHLGKYGKALTKRLRWDLLRHKGRLDYQPLIGNMSPLSFPANPHMYLQGRIQEFLIGWFKQTQKHSIFNYL